MRHRRVAGRRPPTGLAIVAAACLALAACSGAYVGAVPNYQSRQQTSPSAATQKLCQEIAAAMQAVDGGNVAPNMTLAQARSRVDNLMERGIASFTTLAAQAPKLRPGVLQIVAYFRSFERSTDRATSVRQILASVATGSPARQPAYQQLVSYASDGC